MTVLLYRINVQQTFYYELRDIQWPVWWWKKWILQSPWKPNFSLPVPIRMAIESCRIFLKKKKEILQLSKSFKIVLEKVSCFSESKFSLYYWTSYSVAWWQGAASSTAVVSWGMPKIKQLKGSKDRLSSTLISFLWKKSWKRISRYRKFSRGGTTKNWRFKIQTRKSPFYKPGIFGV